VEDAQSEQSGMLAAHIDRVLHQSQAEADADLPWVVLFVCNRLGSVPSWFATNPDLPGCVGHGATESEALEQLRLARRDYLLVLYEEGMPCPTRRSMEDFLSCWV
jgi:predicted RNase H-like HicB family nuclease